MKPETIATTDIHDTNEAETVEWREAFLSLIASDGPRRGREILDELASLARAQRLGWQPNLNTPYVNTIAPEEQGVFPGDLAMEERIGALMRWNALVMVVRASR